MGETTRILPQDEEQANVTFNYVITHLILQVLDNTIMQEKSLVGS